MRKLVIALAAAITVTAAVPASADGLWIGVPGFGIGIGTGPAYGYGPYYDGYWGGRYWGNGYAYAPAGTYSTYAYEPEVEYGAYAYEPAYGYATYAYEPAYGYATYSYGHRDYGYARTYRYRHGPSVRYSRGYDERIRTVRSKSHYGAISRDRTVVRDADSRHHTGMPRNFETGAGRQVTERSSPRIGSEASRAMARSDRESTRVPRSKSLETTTGKAAGDRRNP